MSQYGLVNETVNFPGMVTLRTTNPDPYVSGTTSYLIPNGQKNPLGTAYVDNVPTQIITNSTPTLVTSTNVNGWQTKYRYVQYKSTANTAVVAAPAIVYWVDEAHTQVTSTMSEAFTAHQNDVAGYMMVNSGTISGAGAGSGFTAAVLQPSATTGAYIWIAVAGYVGGASVAASTAAGEYNVGGGAAWVAVRVVAATAAPYRPLCYALTAAGNVSGATAATADVICLCESL